MGRLASNKSNTISKTGIRDRSYSGLGGALNYKQFFKGDVAAFGGFEYQTAYSPLKIHAEISSDDYSYDSSVSNFSINNQLNMGAELNLHNSINVAAYLINNKTVGLSLKISGDPQGKTSDNFMEKATEPFYSTPFQQSDLRKNYIVELTDALKKEKISLVASKKNLKKKL